eukprot:1156619-Pelagomonas_calceolata.AAC.18
MKAHQERNKASVWKLGKTHTTQSNCNRKEHVFRPGLVSTPTLIKNSNHPAIYRTRPSSSGHKA